MVVFSSSFRLLVFFFTDRRYRYYSDFLTLYSFKGFVNRALSYLWLIRWNLNNFGFVLILEHTTRQSSHRRFPSPIFLFFFFLSSLLLLEPSNCWLQQPVSPFNKISISCYVLLTMLLGDLITWLMTVFIWFSLFYIKNEIRIHFLILKRNSTMLIDEIAPIYFVILRKRSESSFAVVILF